MRNTLAILILVLPGFFASALQAEQFGLFTYKISENEVTITDYPDDAFGTVEIPAEIDGKPVVRIGQWGGVSGAFHGCSSLTRIVIPDGVTTLGNRTFSGCTNLISIEVTPGNQHYSSMEGVLFNATRTELVRCPEGRTGEYSIPTGVTNILRGYRGGDGFVGRDGAFGNCSGLTRINIPDSVTQIGAYAFLGCSNLTSIAIPSGVTGIGDSTFRNCTSLESILVEAGNQKYCSLEGILFDADQTTLIRCPERKTSGITIPQGVKVIAGSYYDGDPWAPIGDGAFQNCSELSHVSIPDSVTEIGQKAFLGCNALRSVMIPMNVTILGGSAFGNCDSLITATFLGDAPTQRGIGPYFWGTPPEFTIRYLSGSTGFTSSTWELQSTVRIEEETYPAASWLLKHELPYDSDLNQNMNGDGVSLLMAYALNLDPSRIHQASMPSPVVDTKTGSLKMTFHATSPGITYVVETSTDLQHWTTKGVWSSRIAANNTRTDSVPMESPQRYMRLVIEN